MEALRVLKQPYVFAIVSPVLACILAYFYLKTTRMSEAEIRKFLCKLTLFVTLGNLALAYLADRPEAILKAPFYED